jgi:hypothetical protein
MSAPSGPSYRSDARPRAGPAAPRGPPSGADLDWCSWCGEPSQGNREAPRMAGTIRDRTGQALVDRRNITESARSIKASFATSLRSYDDTRAVSRWCSEPSWGHCYPGLNCNDGSGSHRIDSALAARSCDLAQSRTPTLWTNPRTPPRAWSAGSATLCFDERATIQVSEETERPRMVAAIRGPEGEVEWLHRGHGRHRLRHQEATQPLMTNCTRGG